MFEQSSIDKQPYSRSRQKNSTRREIHEEIDDHIRTAKSLEVQELTDQLIDASQFHLDFYKSVLEELDLESKERSIRLRVLDNLFSNFVRPTDKYEIANRPLILDLALRFDDFLTTTIKDTKNSYLWHEWLISFLNDGILLYLDAPKRDSQGQWCDASEFISFYSIKLFGH